MISVASVERLFPPYPLVRYSKGALASTTVIGTNFKMSLFSNLVAFSAI